MKIKELLSCECEACCPAMFLLEDGQVAVMGVDATDDIVNVPAFAKRAVNERIVVIPKSLIDNLTRAEK